MLRSSAVEKIPWQSVLISVRPRILVPGRCGMTYTEEDWIDDEATAHRGPDA